MGEAEPNELVTFIEGGDVRFVVGNDVRPRKILVAGDSRLELTGTIDRLEIEVLSATVDASGLDVDELTVMLEQSRLVATAARSAIGWVAYGSTMTVGAEADIDELKTANAGRIVRVA